MKTVTTRNATKEAKIKTRSMTTKAVEGGGDTTRQSSLKEAKQRGRQQKMTNKGNCELESLKDIYSNALSSKSLIRKQTGIIYDDSMGREHFCLWDQNYPECPERYSSVMERCRELKLIERCHKLEPRMATKEEILLNHTDEHFKLLEATQGSANNDQLEKLSSHYDAIYIHPESFKLSLLACGSTIELVDEILAGHIQNGMAIIRPPGHHAMKAEFNGYCFFNNVAVAAKHAIKHRGVGRVLIVDWDVHHGQGTQRSFYDDPNVLYISIHRFEHGQFWPNLREGDYDAVGEGEARGRNINVPLNATGMTNADYLAIFNNLIMPVAMEFQPELVIVSAGYDAALGCMEGEMKITPAFYSHLLNPLMALACGRVAVVLEGGYCLDSLAEGAALTLRALIGDPCPVVRPLEAPCESIRDTILNCIYAHQKYWKNLQLHETYSIEELNNVNPQSNLHTIAFDSFVGGEPVPEIFETRNCYPIQSEIVKQELASELLSLKLTTSLNFPSGSRVCFVYDDKMLEHRDFCDHPEKPERLTAIMSRFDDYSLLDRMRCVNSRTATEQELLLVHDMAHIERMRAVVNESNLYEASKAYESVYFHQSTYDCALVSAGSVLNIVDEVLNENSRSAVGIVRPPGHHAECDRPNGFCIFNNIAVAARYATEFHGLDRVLIVDWDVHHGQGTQNIFQDDPKVLYISVHRYDLGAFYPYGNAGDHDQVGDGAGRGFNVNIPWNSAGMGDMEYMLAFQKIIMPIAYEFNPQLVLVSAGFDAADGDPLGKCKLSAEAYGYFTHWLSALANGKIVLVLEGGYNVHSISHSMSMCAKALLGDPLPMLQHVPKLNGIKQSAKETFIDVINTQGRFWKNLSFNKKIPNFDINENSIEHELTMNIQSLTLGDTTDNDNNKTDDDLKQEKSSTIDEAGCSSSLAGTASSSKENSMTLKSFVEANLDALNNGEAFQVVPKTYCPHLEELKPEEAPETFDHLAECVDCHTQIENWICLICFGTFCSRYVNEHCLMHSLATEHPLVLSFSDLSVWCHKCEDYIDNPMLHKFKNLAYRSKFNEELVWRYESDLKIDLTIGTSDDDE